MHKILSQTELAEQVSSWRAQGLKVGFTCGAFDLVHAGHVDYLQRARSLCDRLIVAVNSDSSIRSYKSPFRPVILEAQRMHLIAAFSCVDAVTLMADLRPAGLIELLKPDVYVKGGDYTVAQLRSAPLVESYGGTCAVIPVEHAIGTSEIIRRIGQLALYADPEKVKSAIGGPVVFLDRDGTLIENVHFLNTPSKVKLINGVGPGLRLLQDLGFSLVVITNQQGIGLGYFDYAEFVAVNSEMLRQLSPFGVTISRFYFCPHSMAEECLCRKPGTKLIERALVDFKVAARDCYVIGDSPSDAAAAEAAGCKWILVSGGGTSSTSFAQAVDQIVSNQTQLAAKT